MRRQIKYRTLLVLFILIPVTLIGLFVAAIGTMVHVKAVRRMIDYLGYETNSRIVSDISRFLRAPMLVNRMNADAIASGRVALDDPGIMESLFVSRVKYTPTVTSVYFGNEQGGLVDAGREGPDGELYVILTEGFKAGAFNRYSLNGDGTRGELVSSIPGFDARTRPWYRAASAAGKPTWTEPFLLFTGQDTSISAVHPVFAPDGRLAGVLSVDIFLSQLKALLTDLQTDLGGYCFITDSAGAVLVAPDGSGFPEAAKSKALASAFSSGEDPRGGGFRYSGIVSEGGVRYNVHARPLPEDIGLDWRVFSAYPERAFAGLLKINLFAIIAGSLAAFMVVAAVSMITASVFRKPIDGLVALAQDISQGSWRREPRESRLYETEVLRKSMISMREELRDSFAKLNEEIEAKNEANQRIKALLAEKEIILKEVHHRVKNNLNLIGSLLRIDEGMAPDERSAATFREAASRVKSMALLYDRLFMSDSFAEADVADYARNIARELASQYDPAGLVELRWDVEPVVLPSRYLFPLGIIINEALTNSYKYAFPGGHGAIAIRLARTGGRVELGISDDGVGLGEARAPTDHAAFGMKLIESLVEQIDGELSVSGGHGVDIRISFPAGG